jgi:hypothetical protein
MTKSSDFLRLKQEDTTVVSIVIHLFEHTLRFFVYLKDGKKGFFEESRRAWCRSFGE